MQKLLKCSAHREQSQPKLVSSVRVNPMNVINPINLPNPVKVPH